MAASSKVGSVFDCPICFEKLREPKYLPCLHTFCEVCIQSFIDSSDCGKTYKTKSFNCPVCRRVNFPPARSISAEQWAKQLPKNHLLLAVMDTHQKVFCDSCRHNGEQIIAKLRCKQCDNNLCKTCCKFIHDRVNAFASHAIVELEAENTKVDSKDVPGNCLVHKDKPVELYCFDHEQLGCCFCLTTVHKECKTVLSLDEIAENDLENVANSFIKEAKQMSDLTTRTIQDTKKNITELNHQKTKLLKSVDENIEHIKQRLDSLHSEFRHSLECSYEKETFDLNIVLETLEEFGATLAQRQNIVPSVTEKGDRKNMFIATEKIKQQIYDQVRNMKSKRKQMKRSQLRWTLADSVNKLINVTQLCHFEFTIENFDIVTPIERRYIAIENVRQSTKSESGAQMIKMAISNRILRGISTGDDKSTCDKEIVAAFMIGHSEWCYAFSFHHSCLEVSIPKRPAYKGGFTASLLLNPDKSVRACGPKAISKFRTGDLADCYFFQKMSNVFDFEKTITQDTILKDNTDKELRAIEVFEQSIRSQVEEFMDILQKRIPYRKNTDVKFVFTVPTHSDETVQQLVTDAVLRNGIPLSSISIVLESEAAFFGYQCFARKYEQKKMPVGKKYLVANLGDKISAVSVHYIFENESSNQLLKNSTGPWGLQTVYDEFESCLTEIIGIERMQRFKSEYWFDYLDLVETFEKKFLTLRSSDSEDVMTYIPVSFVECFSENSFATLGEAINLTKDANNLTLTGDKLRWKKDRFVQFADKVIAQIIEHIRALLASEMADVEAILLTGKLSESDIVENAVRKYFGKNRIMTCYTDAALSGAVYIGHLVNSRNLF